MTPSDREQADAGYGTPPPKTAKGTASSAAAAMTEVGEELTNSVDAAAAADKQRHLSGGTSTSTCSEMRCQRGGYCVEDRGGRRTRCLCPLGTKGRLCETGSGHAQSHCCLFRERPKAPSATQNASRISSGRGDKEVRGWQTLPFCFNGK